MLPVRDPDGVRTGRQAVSHTLGLIPVALPGLSGWLALLIFGPLLLGIAFLWCAIHSRAN